MRVDLHGLDELPEVDGQFVGVQVGTGLVFPDEVAAHGGDDLGELVTGDVQLAAYVSKLVRSSYSY